MAQFGDMGLLFFVASSLIKMEKNRGAPRRVTQGDRFGSNNYIVRDIDRYESTGAHL